MALTSLSCGAACATLSLEHELRRFLDAERAGGDAAILQPLRDRSYGLSSSFQVAHVGLAAAERPERDLLARAVLFERRADEERLALARERRTANSRSPPPQRMFVK